jgi:hypothetical protein
MHRLLRALALVLCCLVALGASVGVAAERRVALVIGNAAYKNPALDIANARNDAEDTAAALRALGFEVLLQTDVDLAAASKAIQQFARMSVGADAALFYFAGHAVQYQGHNYLLPIDAEVRDDISLPFETIGVENVRAVLRSAGVKIMVLDACRTNPVSDRLTRLASASGLSGAGERGLGERARGLDRTDRSEGLIVAFATAPGAVALDGQDRNSPYTNAFLRRLNEPGLEIEMMFRRIAADVAAATRGRQHPETYVSLVAEYYLNQNDKIAWDRIRGTENPSDLHDFIERFPSSFYAIEARYRLQALERAIAEAKQRARREAEISEREREVAAREAAARLEAEQACKADRAALAATGPRDADRLRRLALEACAEVKAAAQKRLGDLETAVAAEAEACRRDAAALAAIAAGDLGGLKSLLQTASCPEVKTAIAAKAAAIEADLAREAETCRRENGDILGFIKGGDAAGLSALAQRAHCAATAGGIAEGIRAIAAAAQAACDRDEAALKSIGSRDLGALRGFLANAACEGVKIAARARLTELEALLARETALCQSEDSELKGLVEKGDSAQLEALRGRAQCPATAAAAEKGLRKIAAAADAACAQADAALNGIGPRDADALRGLIDKAPCAAVRAAAVRRLDALVAALAREAEACRRDDARWAELAKSADRAGVEAFRKRVECDGVRTAVDRRLAEIAELCRRDEGALAAIGARDADGLRGLLGQAQCAEVKAVAGARLATLEESLEKEAELCRRDEALWRDFASPGDRAAIAALRQRAACPGVIAAIDKALAELKAACGREQAAFAALGANEGAAAKALLASAVCEDVRTAARLRIARIEADAARQAEACGREEAEFAALKARGADGRGPLIDLKRRMTCARLRPDLEAALEQLPAPPAAAPAAPSRNDVLRRPKKETIARLPPRDVAPAEEPRPKAVEPRPAREKAARPPPAEKPARPAPAEKPIRHARPAQPERQRPAAQPPAQASARAAPARPASVPLGVGY